MTTAHAVSPQRLHQLAFPDREEARRAVNRAIASGLMEPARKHRCVDCGGQADQWDHYLGYEPEYRLCVLPRCIRCHSKQGRSPRQAKNLLPPKGVRRSDVERFMSHVQIDPETGCWLWQGGVHKPSGHPQFKYGAKQQGYARHFAYEQWRDERPRDRRVNLIPDCGNPLCVHFLHSKPVPHTVALRNRRRPVARTHCEQGHELEIVTPRTGITRRICRECRAARERERYGLKKPREQLEAIRERAGADAAEGEQE